MSAERSGLIWNDDDDDDDDDDNNNIILYDKLIFYIVGVFVSRRCT
jgi:hypothetical protein